MKVIMLGLHNLAKVYDKLSTSLKRSGFQSKGTKDKLTNKYRRSDETSNVPDSELNHDF
jgi:hypothetical protein